MRDKITKQCDLCRGEFQYGPGLYEGRWIAKYKLLVCKTCWASNWDGWSPAHEPAFLSHLAKHGIELPPRNADGYYPRE